MENGSAKFYCLLQFADIIFFFLLTLWRWEITIPLVSVPTQSLVIPQRQTPAWIFSWPLKCIIIALSPKCLQLQLSRSVGLKHQCAGNPLDIQWKCRFLLGRSGGGERGGEGLRLRILRAFRDPFLWQWKWAMTLHISPSVSGASWECVCPLPFYPPSPAPHTELC